MKRIQLKAIEEAKNELDSAKQKLDVAKEAEYLAQEEWNHAWLAYLDAAEAYGLCRYCFADGKRKLKKLCKEEHIALAGGEKHELLVLQAHHVPS
jgi:hypothetical protein